MLLNMRLSELKEHLQSTNEVAFVLPGGQTVPAHFHVTEAGLVSRNYIDCGGTIREEFTIRLQLWVAGDTEHRLTAHKLLHILDKAEPLFKGIDADIEVEYQQDTIARYGLALSPAKQLVLQKMRTACLATDHCGIQPEHLNLTQKYKTKSEAVACCSPESGCC